MDKLAKSSSGQITTVESSSKKCLARMRDLAAMVTNYEITSGETKLWEPLLAYRPEEIEKGFQCYFLSENCAFMPRPGQILALMRENAVRQGQERKWRETDEMLKRNREARESGKTVSLAEIEQIIADMAKEKAIPPLLTKPSTSSASAKPTADARKPSISKQESGGSQ